MRHLEFRALRADEIEVRVASVREDGLSLLLYKDARVDQNVLDETVGPMNWQRHHSRENKNCTVSIWDEDKQQWIEKEDTGTESYTEAEKGLASDSFKRACFNWGIGRELYTAPFIWVKASDCNIKKSPKNGNLGCYDRFYVAYIDTAGGKITSLAIANGSKGNMMVYTLGKMEEKQEEAKPEARPEIKPRTISEKEKADLIVLAKKAGVDVTILLQQAQVQDLMELSYTAGAQMAEALKRKIHRAALEAKNGAEGQTA